MAGRGRPCLWLFPLVSYAAVVAFPWQIGRSELGFCASDFSGREPCWFCGDGRHDQHVGTEYVKSTVKSRGCSENTPRNGTWAMGQSPQTGILAEKDQQRKVNKAAVYCLLAHHLVVGRCAIHVF
jgi:hypothetical protein